MVRDPYLPEDSTVPIQRATVGRSGYARFGTGLPTGLHLAREWGDKWASLGLWWDWRSRDAH